MVAYPPQDSPSLKIIDYDRTAFVSKTFIDNDNTHRFTTIQEAIDWIHDSSWYGDLDANNKAVVMVYPGYYKEQLTSWEHIRLVSIADHANLNKRKSVHLTIPDDKKTEAVFVSGSAYSYNVSGFTVQADPVENGPYASATMKAYFFNCEFENGSFLDGDAAYACDLSLFGCEFNSGTNAINYTGARGHADRTIYMFNTWSHGDIIANSTFATGSPSIEFKRCPMSCKTIIAGDWNYKMKNSRLTNTTGSANRSTFGTTGIIDISDSVSSGGIHFTSNPSEVHIEHCDFNEPGATVITGADITSDVAITNVNYNHNLQQNGISGKIQTQCPVKPVGCKTIDRFMTLQDAIDSIVTKGVVDLQESLTGLSELTIPSNTNVTIDGHKLNSLTFTADIVEVNATQELVFYGLSSLNGGNIEINGNGSYVGFEECLTVNAYVTMTSGTNSYCLVYTSTIKAPADQNAITINNTDGTVVVGYSRIDGGTNKPAIWFTVEADNRLKGKFSTFLHGNGGVNSPIDRDGGYTVTVSLYLCAGNNILTPAGIANDITGSGNTNDGNIDF